MDISPGYRKLTLKEIQDAEQYVDSLFSLLKSGIISDEQLAGDIKELISAFGHGDTASAVNIFMYPTEKDVALRFKGEGNTSR